MKTIPKPVCLIILDGWGHREDPSFNAISAAKKPNWNNYWQNFPHTLIQGSGRCVGLPDEQMGNSEVGHLNMGAGRVVYQDLTRIDLAIQNGDFFNNPILQSAVNAPKISGNALHVLGLLSPGGVHSHEKHIIALLQLAQEQGLEKIYFHMFLDGRDTPPRSALASIELLNQKCQEYNRGKIVSLIGRYYAMDRDNRWERVQKAYDLISSGIAPFHAMTAEEALLEAYARGENDEFVDATSIHDPEELPICINDNDTVIFMNFRSDRAREITQAFINPDFTGFHRQKFAELKNFITLTEYDSTFTAPVVFPPQRLTNILAQELSRLGLKQLRIAETEKYAHVTFFFNGGVEAPFPKEDRILIPSPKVATYDLQPAMSARELTQEFIKAIHSGEYDVIICNYANPDMVGHTGNMPATIEAIEVIDECLGKIITALNTVGGEALITADHGNAELMYDEKSQQPHTAHTSEVVPLLYIGRTAQVMHEDGILADIAPTILNLLNITPPIEMTGRNLFEPNT